MEQSNQEQIDTLIDSGPPPAPLVDAVEGYCEGDCMESIQESMTEEDQGIDAGQPPAHLIDEIEGMFSEVSDLSEFDVKDHVDAGSPPDFLLEEVEGIDMDIIEESE
jgi:hypothetical protein